MGTASPTLPQTVSDRLERARRTSTSSPSASCTRTADFYANLATAVAAGRAETWPSRWRAAASVVRIAARDGAVEVVAHGLRAPNGIGLGPGGRALRHRQPGRLAAREQAVARAARRVLRLARGGLRAAPSSSRSTPPVVWLPHAEVGNSPSQPVAIEIGPWRGPATARRRARRRRSSACSSRRSRASSRARRSASRRASKPA